MTIVTRFAPSPTGFLHIGGARTALFNWLFTRHHGGKFLLRIEDTDRKRSTQEAVDAIIDGIKWLGLDWDDNIHHQYESSLRHAEVAKQLVADNKAYYCYCTPEELSEMRKTAEAEGRRFRYDNTWRDRPTEEAPKDAQPSIRLKAPLSGNGTITDLVQGTITVPNEDLDDMILLRSDGTPTYMLAAVVDDHDMGVTHIIRGDDHLTNSFRQKVIYDAMGWTAPAFSHVPLIHGSDGAKLSKRHGALGVDAYRDMGYLPEALRNYLLRLGWSHGDDEIISTEQAIKWFGLDAIGKSPSRFDFDKLNHINAHYIQQADNQRLFDLIIDDAESASGSSADPYARDRILKGMDTLKTRANTLKQLADGAAFYIARPDFTEKALTALNQSGIQIINDLMPRLDQLTPSQWNADDIKEIINQYANENELKPRKIFPPIRAAICGTMEAPSLFDVLDVMGKDESLARLKSTL